MRWRGKQGTATQNKRKHNKHGSRKRGKQNGHGSTTRGKQNGHGNRKQEETTLASQKMRGKLWGVLLGLAEAFVRSLEAGKTV